MTKIYVFAAKELADIYAYTKEEDGKNLPTSYQNKKSISWSPFRVLDVQEGEPPRIGLNTEEMLTAIEKTGYYTNTIPIDIQIQE